jgi:2-polyprenyl-3-methyl-5-hydroxy-6-metoxy-1,4-benzoquinol methylase
VSHTLARDCEACGRAAVTLVCDEETLAAENARPGTGFDPHVIHGEPSAIYRCEACGTVSRALTPRAMEESTTAYADTSYTDDELDALFERTRLALDADTTPTALRDLRVGARVLEIGSYCGAFLSYATDAGCRVTGLDVNPCMARYSRRRGYHVHHGRFTARDLPEAAFDGICVLNCFEQLPEPDAALEDAMTLLRPGGFVLLRTPNAAFLDLVHARPREHTLRAIAAANALGGVPYARCYSPAALTVLLRRAGFVHARLTGREFSPLPPRGWSQRWRQKRPAREAMYRRAARRHGTTAHPWLEVLAFRPRAGAEAALAPQTRVKSHAERYR